MVFTTLNSFFLVIQLYSTLHPYTVLYKAEQAKRVKITMAFNKGFDMILTKSALFFLKHEDWELKFGHAKSLWEISRVKLKI